jgi:hypothetical protein
MSVTKKVNDQSKKNPSVQEGFLNSREQIIPHRIPLFFFFFSF